MSGADDFHKRLERIQDSHAGGKTVMRPTPSGIRDNKIGLVREKEEEPKGKKRGVVVRLLFLLIVGVVGVRFALAGLADMTPEVLDARQAELMAQEDYQSKAQGAVLMVMGAADPLIGRFLPSPETIKEVLEETVAANLPEAVDGSDSASSDISNEEAEVSSVADPVVTSIPSQTLTLDQHVANAPLPEPLAPSTGLFDRLFASAGLTSSDGLKVVLPSSPPSGWQMVREEDIKGGAAAYQTAKNAWTASGMPTPWDQIPFMGSFVQTLNTSAEEFQAGERFLRLYFTPDGQAALVEYLVLDAPVDPSNSAALVPAGGDEIFVEIGEVSHWFKSTTRFDEGADDQIFRALLGDRVLMGVRLANTNSIELRDLLLKLPLNSIASAGL